MCSLMTLIPHAQNVLTLNRTHASVCLHRICMPDVNPDAENGVPNPTARKLLVMVVPEWQVCYEGRVQT